MLTLQTCDAGRLIGFKTRLFALLMPRATNLLTIKVAERF